ncbi:LysE family translocator [Amorphus orientalis]|uniref:Threonine/homoserine/homoserine lactone efflux protein n=1 Tax=Amorphus orientalis TaxID=649198 RepID=A0AAE3VRT0_9HYPH|nr:LysE family transporter [Amorphus orientalis]MDQ0317015.1 threonine/homoserine/homoserine lactone efflux protein [Amorphus orientalis]
MLEVVLVVLSVAVPLMGSPGPSTLSSAAVGSAFGVRAGLAYVAGICLGTSTVVLVVASGVTGIVFAVPGLLPVLTIAAAIYILYLAWKIATAPVTVARDAGTKAPSFLPGYLLAIANPKAYAAFSAILGSTATLGDGSGAFVVLRVAVVVALVFVVNPAWLLLGSAFTRVLSSPRWGRVVNIVFACLLVASMAAVFI